ncbi:hypothetical protein TNCT_356441 [Trichonephila clavata]|uniref:Uncharacterized protein n=1 Tax=Trichonephila clavata TaxID=2740835 RepID=A0A8X6I1C5_TRICU|nr:hypothetical protein TNCT_356441 [Trichonephila clavata]
MLLSKRSRLKKKVCWNCLWNSEILLSLMFFIYNSNGLNSDSEEGEKNVTVQKIPFKEKVCWNCLWNSEILLSLMFFIYNSNGLNSDSEEGEKHLYSVMEIKSADEIMNPRFNPKVFFLKGQGMLLSKRSRLKKRVCWNCLWNSEILSSLMFFIYNSNGLNSDSEEGEKNVTVQMIPFKEKSLLELFVELRNFIKFDVFYL